MRPELDSTIERLAYSPAEAAATLGVSRQFVYSLISRGQLRTVTLGRRRLIPRDALLDCLAEAS